MAVKQHLDETGYYTFMVMAANAGGQLKLVIHKPSIPVILSRREAYVLQKWNGFLSLILTCYTFLFHNLHFPSPVPLCLILFLAHLRTCSPFFSCLDFLLALPPCLHPLFHSFPLSLSFYPPPSSLCKRYLPFIQGLVGSNDSDIYGFDSLFLKAYISRIDM